MDEKVRQEQFELFFNQFINDDAKEAYHVELVQIMDMIKDALHVAYITGWTDGVEYEPPDSTD